ncbi:MAG: hypothetical protein JSR71_01525 [Proteobacteria bacterium]|nr:hypothetical protein [Pseudomonadota bacterium]
MLRLAPLDRLNDLGSLQDGFDSKQIKTRQQQYGDNRIVETPQTGWRDILRNTASNYESPLPDWFLAIRSC